MQLPAARFGLLPERFGMQLPRVLRSFPSRLGKVRVGKALLSLAASSCSPSAWRCAASSRAFAWVARSRHLVRSSNAVAPTPELAVQSEAAVPTCNKGEGWLKEHELIGPLNPRPNG
jgi:hypothetical protein